MWPWLAQFGQDRGGFYSFDVLENLVGCEMPTDDRLRPEKQHWQIGDRLWMYPKDKAGGAGFATLRVYMPGRAMGFGARSFETPLTAAENGSWSLILTPIDATHTRLLVRGRGAPGRSLLSRAFDRSVFEPMHFVMERRMMIGLKEVAETGRQGRVTNHLLVASWVVTFGLLVAALVRRATWKLPLAAFVSAAVVFQILTLVQPPAILAWGLVAIPAALLWRDSRRAGDSGKGLAGGS